MIEMNNFIIKFKIVNDNGIRVEEENEEELRIKS